MSTPDIGITSLQRASIGILGYHEPIQGQSHFVIVDFPYHPYLVSRGATSASTYKWCKTLIRLDSLPPLPDPATVAFIRDTVRDMRRELENAEGR